MLKIFDLNFRKARVDKKIIPVGKMYTFIRGF